jgi:hypothetical protein
MRGARMRTPGTIIAAVLLLCGLSACGGGTPSLVGNWRADDGTGTKVITSDGRCSGMFYLGPGEPLDIGGGMGCSLSTKKGSDGRYSLVVWQPLIGEPLNQETLKVSFDGDDKATIYDSSGDRLFSMTRQ